MLLTARYVLPVTYPHIEDGAVLVRDGRIADVGDRAELTERYADEETHDFGLAALLPGFIDLHTHLEYAVFRGLVDDLPYSQWKMQLLVKEKALSEQDWEDSALLGAVETLRSGITTIADITESGASARAAAAAGLRGVIYREVATRDKERIPGLMEEALRDMERWALLSPEGLLTTGLAPHAPYSCHPLLFRAVADHCIENGTRAATHLAGSRDEYDLIKYGSSPLAIEYPRIGGQLGGALLPTGVSPVRYVLQWGLFDIPNLLAIHCVQVDDADIDVLAGRNVSIAHCPRCSAKWGMGITPLLEFMKRGLTIGIGTDSPASNNTVDFFDEMRIGLLLQRGSTGEVGSFTAENFVKMATIGGARALGMESEIGSLEAGKHADVIAVDLSHSHQVPTEDPYGALVYTANQENVLMTMVGGEIRYELGGHADIDSGPVKEKAQAMRAKLAL